MAGRKEWSQLARAIMEEHLGRSLTYDENVHHIDRDTTNNNLNNLMLMSRSEHTSFHKLEIRDKISKDRMGHKLSQETRDRISKAHSGCIGHPVSEETKDKIRKGSIEHNTGHHRSQETRNKISRTSHQRWQNKFNKKGGEQ